MASSRHDHCCVPLCTNDSRYDVEGKLSFHSFPSDANLRKAWTHAIRRDVGPHFTINVGTKVCSAHFKPSVLKKTLAGKRVLSKGAVPELFPWKEEHRGRKAPKARVPVDGEHSGAENRMDIDNDSDRDEEYMIRPLHDHDYYYVKVSVEEQLEAAIQRIQRLEIENSQLTSLQFSAQRFTTDDEMLRFYTGFQSYELFYVTYKCLEPTASRMLSWTQVQRKKGQNVATRTEVMKHESLCCIDQFFLFLCYCKSGLFEKDLASRFNISISTVSRIVITWANYLYHMLGSLPVWPSRDQIDTHMPECFKSMYPKTRVILDCTELKCQTPSALYVNSQMYSHYKSHSTFKGLIGITPSGGVCFVSQLYSGSISDVDITGQSGIVNLLEVGDDVMADKGFTISNLLAKRGATLNIPPFLTAKRPQFSKEEVVATQSIARVRIHVERAIRRVKEYHIFDGVLPLSIAGSINQIWTVCALLTNFRGPLF